MGKAGRQGSGDYGGQLRHGACNGQAVCGRRRLCLHFGARPEQARKAVKEIGRNVTGIQADSSKVADLERLFEQVKKEKGHIDVLFASAGHGGMVPLGSITEDQFDEFFGLNTRGTLFTIQMALPLLNDGAAIIMNGSIAGIKGLPGLSVYGASKAALRSLARTWAAELKDRKIRTNVLSPDRSTPR